MTVPALPPPGSAARARGARFPLVLAFVALGLGLWLLLDSVGLPLPRIRRWWPIFLVVAGVATLVDYLRFGRRPAALGQTVFWLGLAAFCFAITFGLAGWRNVLDLVPGVPTLFGLALLTTWFASSRRETGLLVPGLLFLGLGLAGFVARFEALQRLVPSVQVIWAVLLLVGGGLLLHRILTRHR
jgi:hypothetical protein